MSVKNYRCCIFIYGNYMASFSTQTLSKLGRGERFVDSNKAKTGAIIISTGIYGPNTKMLLYVQKQRLKVDGIAGAQPLAMGIKSNVAMKTTYSFGKNTVLNPASLTQGRLAV